MAHSEGIRQEGLSVVIAGASGLIGTQLAAELAKKGHSVYRLVRTTPRDATEYQWNPSDGSIQSGVLDHIDVVVNLSGASIGKIPWTKKYKDLILHSRLSATRTLVRAITEAQHPPRALVQASAVGFYGDRGDEELTEDSSRGDGFLADVCIAWESETSSLPESVRVAIARTGLVIARGGAMAPLRLQTMLGAAGPVGSGEQWWPWISLHDEVRALVYMVENPLMKGAYNLTAPTPAPSREVTRELARQMGRPHWLGLPTLAINALMGEAGRELLLSSQKVQPTRLEQAGFHFEDTTIDQAIARII